MDEILCYTLAGGQARAYVAATSDLCAEAMRIHGLSHVAAAALGRTMTCASILGVQMKNNQDTLTVTVKGDGPLGTITCTAKNSGAVKGFVQNPNVELMLRPDGKLNVGAAVGSVGRLTVVKDLGMKEPYVGNVALQTGEIAEDFAYYFALSEQQPSAVALGVLTDHGRVSAAGGVILQPLPGCSEEVLRFLEGSVPLLFDVSSHFVGNTARQVGEILLAPIQHELVGTNHPAYRCDCGREKIEKVLISLGEKELQDMINTQHGSQITCHFCNKVYEFSEQELVSLKKEAAHGKP